MKKRTDLYIRSALLPGVLCLILVTLIACGGNRSQTPANTSTEGLLFSENGDGTLTVTGYEGTESAVIIDLYDGKEIREIATGAFSGNDTVIAVTLGMNVTRIGVASFADCASLTEVNATHSALTRIGNAAFLGCDALASVSLPATVESIGVDAFLGCDALVALSFDGDGMAWTRVKVGAHNDVLDGIVTLQNGEIFSGAFLTGECTSTVTWLLDDDGNLILTGEGHVPDYGYAEAPWYDFADKIRTVTVDGGIDIVGKNAFGGCTALTSVTLAESVRLIDDSTFYGCVSLEQVALPTNLRRIGSGAFYGCAALTAITVPDSVTHIGGGAFMNCSRLAEVTLGKGITSLEQWTFSGCERLTKITVTAEITEIGKGAFYGCPAELTPSGN